MTPSSADLRSFLAQVRSARPSDLLEVAREVDPNHETAAILAVLEARQRSPILYFHRVRGCEWPLVTNVCGSLGRLALGLGCGLKEVAARYADAAHRPIAPVVVEQGSVHEVVLEHDAVDLHRFPALRYHEDDAPQPYLTAAIVVARDPDDGVTNLSYHRLMIASRNTTGIYIEPGRHLDGIVAKHAARGTDVPVAVVLGTHPAWSLGALYSGPAATDEYDVIGGMLGAPLPVVRCHHDPALRVPASAEFVLEGRIAVGERMDEGPFGEFTGFGTGRTHTPVLHVERMCHRAQPIVQDIVSGHLEHLMLSMPALEHRALRDAKAAAPGVVKVALVAPLTVVVALRKHDDEEPARIADALLRDVYGKIVIVVDDDVEPTDLARVLGAVALSCQPHEQLRVVQGLRGTPLDPSCPDDRGQGSKLAIDATRPLRPRRAVTRNRIPQAVLDRIDVAELLGKK
ncbi:MAG: UbiD family decarboxylase [Nannocystaceae bacterium]|nr:UbiD family decarboxylase [Nannocystaceae bacterium]